MLTAYARQATVKVNKFRHIFSVEECLVVLHTQNGGGVVVFFTIFTLVFSGVNLTLVADELGETLSVGGDKGLLGLGVEEHSKSPLSILTLLQLSFGFFTAHTFFVGFPLITTGFAGLLLFGLGGNGNDSGLIGDCGHFYDDCLFLGTNENGGRRSLSTPPPPPPPARFGGY